jgi:hypothetical protein
MARTYTAAQMIAAIPSSGGIVSTIAKRVGCDWHTVKTFIDTYPTVKAAYDNECEKVLDMAESVLLKNIENGDSADAKWYLSRKGKRRGYVERSEVTGADGGPLVIEYVNDWRNAEQD